MKIIILGAGQVGSSVAANLVSEANDITVVDRDARILQALSERLDLRTVLGQASHPTVLERAGAADADMIIAVTNSDETNMVACQVAYTVYRTPMRIARIREMDYQRVSGLFTQQALPIDVLISPEQIVTDYIERLIDVPGVMQVLDFAGGKAQMVALQVHGESLLIGSRIVDVCTEFPSVQFRIASVFRDGRSILPEGDTVIQCNDEIFVIGSPKDIRRLLKSTRMMENPIRKVMIAGGGNIGVRLARALEERYQVKVIEYDPHRAAAASELLDQAIVLNGDAADEELLMEEHVDDVDMFCALTNFDEANIISCMLAKRLGARKVLALINRAAYVDLIQSDVIDIAVSPQLATIGTLLAHIRRGDVTVVHSLRRGAAEAMEAVAHGDRNSSRVVGRRIDELALPQGTSIGAVVRGDAVLVAHHDTVIEAEDHVILLVTDKKRVRDVERLFQVSVTFL
jgi:trk system potassium uptake protein TrkA